MTQSPKLPNPSPSSIPRDDPRYPIWGRIFLCRVPRIARFSTEYLEQFGMHSSGIAQVDRELAMQLESVYIPINDMVEYYHTHQRVCIVRQDDVKTIYEICQDYTFNAGESLNRTVYSHQVPFADLIKIDEFAEAVYVHAAHMYGKDFARTFLPENVMREATLVHDMFAAVDKRVKDREKNKLEKKNDVTVYTKLSPNRPKTDEERKQVEAVKDLPSRPSMRDLFMSYMDGTGFAGRL